MKIKNLTHPFEIAMFSGLILALAWFAVLFLVLVPNARSQTSRGRFRKFSDQHTVIIIVQAPGGLPFPVIVKWW